MVNLMFTGQKEKYWVGANFFCLKVILLSLSQPKSSWKFVLLFKLEMFKLTGIILFNTEAPYDMLLSN